MFEDFVFHSCEQSQVISFIFYQVVFPNKLDPMLKVWRLGWSLNIPSLLSSVVAVEYDCIVVSICLFAILSLAHGVS